MINIRLLHDLQRATTVYIAELVTRVSTKSQDTVQLMFVLILFLSTVMLTEECNITGWSVFLTSGFDAKMEPVSQLMEQFPLYWSVLQSTWTDAVPSSASVGVFGLERMFTTDGGSEHKTQQ